MTDEAGNGAGRLLVVNADDFGYAASVNAGILDAHAAGLVTAATWLAGGEAAAGAATLARAHPGLDVGLHLALSELPPCAAPDAVWALLDGGRLPPDYRAVWRRLRKAPGLIGTVEVEWRAQYAAFRAAFGRAPSHVDSHQHVALFPALQPLFVRLAREQGVAFVRIPEEVQRVHDLIAPPGLRRLGPAVVLSGLARRLRARATQAGLRTTDHFAGFRTSGRATRKDLLGLAAHLRPGTTEWMVHPGRADTADGCRRAAEHAALTDPSLAMRLTQADVRLVTFRHLARGEPG